MKALAVLGMHRSYTSLAARWLAECGIQMGEKTLGGGIGNVDGHFEDVDFLEFHKKVLLANGLASNGMAELGSPSFDCDAYRSLNISGRLAEEGEALIKRKWEGGQDFGWKEPRTCLFLPFYRSLLDLRALILFRPAGEVVASLVAREKRVLLERVFPGFRRPGYWLEKKQWSDRFETLEASYFEAWAHYNECLLEHIAKTDRDKFVVHDLRSLLTHDAAVLEKLNEWGFECRHVPIATLHRPKLERLRIRVPDNLAQRIDEITRRFSSLTGP